MGGYDLVQQIFAGLVTELVAVGLAWRYGADIRKRFLIICVGTIIAGFLALRPISVHLWPTQPSAPTPASLQGTTVWPTLTPAAGMRRVDRQECPRARYSVRLRPIEPRPPSAAGVQCAPSSRNRRRG